ncbi:hypothetical protein OEZ86_002476 [Tetradesmus obliquus]|uniref:Uncharacterized protein n=2 Tax=Tetradesmus obliquus TaxID=3088 RepID=A0A383VJ67_TETOB|nr:hypothetical protein OEZ85_011617 [Tetradesmus obliquus]WIA31588.1 hypothetical protein OEZ86_002476 [Tetradesmus obliquus]|eukprot:jgi/Sobl393_1/10782/SZX64983.1
MAAYGGHAAVADLGLQIFVTLRKGKSWPPSACDVRVRYDQTIADVKAAVAEKMGVPAEQQQLFHHKRELTAAYDSRTLLEMNMHTGFALKGYDLSEAPDYWPPVKETDEGLREEDADA